MRPLSLRCAVGTSLAAVWISGSSLAQAEGKTAQSAPASSAPTPAGRSAGAPTTEVIGQQTSPLRATEQGAAPSVPVAPGAGPPSYATPGGYWYYGPPLQPTEPPSRWYGWQTLTADGSALSLVFLAASIRGAEEPFLWVAAGAYLLVPPGIHVAHGNVVKGVGSLLLRVGAPTLGGLIGFALEDCPGRSDFCGLGGAAIGGLVGYASAVTIDAAVLAREDSPAEPRRTGGPRLHLLPLIGRDVHGVALGGLF